MCPFHPGSIAKSLRAFSNSWYRVRHTLEEDPESGGPVVRFIHPVAPGNGGGGWIKPAEEPKSEDSKGTEKTFSLEEIAKHNKKVRPLCASGICEWEWLMRMWGDRTMLGSFWIIRCMMLRRCCRGTLVRIRAGLPVYGGLIRIDVRRWCTGDLGVCREGDC